MVSVLIILGWSLALYALGALVTVVFMERLEAQKYNSFYIPIGFIFLGTAVPMLMKLGIDLKQISFLMWIAAAIGTWIQFKTESFLNKNVILGFAVTVAILSAQIFLAGPQYYYFQGNIWDHLNYISATALFTTMDINSFARSPEQIPILAQTNPFIFWAANWEARPSVSTTLAVLAYPFLNANHRYLEVGALYCSLMAALQFCSLVFILHSRAMSTAKTWLLIGVAAAISVGFWAGFMLDTNAWSQLAVASIAPGVLWMAFRLTATSPTFNQAIFSGILVSGLFFYYPEYFVFFGLILLVAVIWNVYKQKTLVPFWAFVPFFALIISFKEGTILFLLQQMKFSSDNIAISKQWFEYFYSFPFQLDFIKSSSITWIDTLSGYFITFASLLGLYPIMVLNLSWYYNLLSAAILGPLCMIAFGSALYYGWKNFRLFFFAVVVGMITTLAAAKAGNLYGAGKLYVWTTPFMSVLFALSFLSIKTPSFIRWLLGTFLVAYASSGLVRIPTTLQEAGRPGRLPYPADQDLSIKSTTNFNAKWQNELRLCSGIEIDVSNPFLRQIAVLEIEPFKKPFRTVQNLNSYYDTGVDYGALPIKNVDCYLTFGQLEGGQRGFIISKLPR